MAKTDEIKFLDQHMEKVILGVCALIMAYGVFQWVLSASPRTEVPKVRGRVVAAEDIDQELLSWAQSIQNRQPSKDSGRATPKFDTEIARQRADAERRRCRRVAELGRKLAVPENLLKSLAGRSQEPPPACGCECDCGDGGSACDCAGDGDDRGEGASSCECDCARKPEN